jgi:LemA protein
MIQTTNKFYQMVQRATPVSRHFVHCAILFVAVTLAGCGVNNIPTYENNAKAKWSEVLSQYKRRADLIPNLVESVKGFAEQEKSVLTQVTEARARATSTSIPADILTNPEAMKKLQDAQNSLGGALRQLMVVSERYPDVKSGQNFLALQNQLEGTENRISIARRDYIESVRAFNTEISTIPGRWWRSLMYPQSKEMATFDIPADEQRTPKVDFSAPKKN